MTTTTTSGRGNAIRWGAVRYADVTHPSVRSLPPLAFRLWVLLHTYSATIVDGAPHYGAWQVGSRRLADDLGIEGADDDRRKSVRRAVRALVDAELLAVTPQTHEYSRADAWSLYSLCRPPAYGQPCGQPMDNLGTSAEGEGRSDPAIGASTPPPGGRVRPTSHTPKQTRTEKTSIQALGREAGEAAERLRAELVGMIATYMDRQIPTLFSMVSALVDEHTADVLRSSSVYSGKSEAEWSLAVDYYNTRIEQACGVSLLLLSEVAADRDAAIRVACWRLRDQLPDLTRGDVAAALLSLSADTRETALRAAGRWGEHARRDDG
jgi:hypothetical protein